MTKKYPLVSIIVVNFNGKHLLGQCFKSLAALDYPKQSIEIIMIDNGSKDGSVTYVRKNFPKVKIVKNKNNNYCLANNLGIKNARGEFVAILNNDTEVDRNWLRGLITVIRSNKRIAVAGSKILLFDGKIQSVGHAEFPYHYWGDQGFLEEDKGQYNEVREVKSVSNCSALYRKSVFDKVGYFDEDFVMYMEDVDMAFRIRNNGLKIYYAPKSIVRHHFHGSGQDDNERKFYIEKNRLLFVAKYFPDKLSDIMFGNGEINRLKPVLFQRLLAELLSKLIVLYGSSKAHAIFSKISESISKMQIYGEHCLSVDSGNRIEVIQKDLTAKQLALEEKDNQVRTLLEKVAVLESQSSNLTNELHLKEGHLSSQQAELKEKDNQVRTLLEKVAVLESQSSDSINELLLKDDNLTAKQLALEEKDNQVRTLLEKVAVLESQSSNLTNELHLKEGHLSSQQAELKEKDNQVRTLLEKVAVLESQSSNLTNELHLKEGHLSSQQAELKEKENEIRTLLEKLAALENQSANLTKELRLKDQNLNNQKAVILTKDEQLNSQVAALAEKGRQVNEFIIQSAIKDEQIVNFSKEAALKIEQLSSQQAALDGKENQLSLISSLLLKRDEDIRTKDKELLGKDSKINTVLTQLSGTEMELKRKEEEIRAANEQLRTKDALIAQKIQELSNIYNSDTFRIFVRPIIWPFFSFIKKVKNTCKNFFFLLGFKETQSKAKACPQNHDIKITQFIAGASHAKIGQKNEYLVKIFNKGFKEARGILVVDIWPYLSPSHPQRHYAYFAAEFSLSPRSSIEAKVNYDWEKTVQFILSGDEVETKHFWRGPAITDDFYQIDAYLRDPENKIMDSLKILQKLSR